MIIIYIISGISIIFLLTVIFGPPFVPSHSKQVEKLFQIINLSKSDVLIDLGSGDGRVLRLASSRIKRGVGLEINPILVGLSKIWHRRITNLEFHWTDARFYQLPHDATVVYVFGAKSFVQKIAKDMERFVSQYQRSLIIASYGFEIPFSQSGRQHGAYWVYYLSPLPSPTKLLQ